jgi:NAD dependent epimerase/dehydratase family enzyme
VLVNGSAVGFYGSSLVARFSETSPAGCDFLAEICQRWEAAADLVPPACRLVTLRIGIVLGPDGGALGKMLPVFRMGFGGPVGSGRQWMSWINRNAVSPEPTTMGLFAAALGKALGRPSLLPVPGPILQLLLGDGAQVVLEGQQVLPERLLAQGFPFQFPQLSAALAAATSPAPH